MSRVSWYPLARTHNLNLQYNLAGYPHRFYDM
ncbi:hypothetical protein AC4HA13_0024 [Escherichia phage vB_EcoM_4HA13]|uniref:Uncharacterized protein n=1 Tax=Escherichia phage vB_EcoM_4HA13 TaxID=2601675 RepID=A0A8F4TDH6_9CAUD|nr:hypothetical protein HYP96_gp24 [Escherichia phage vB_EcoM_4HA13]QXG07482.1 hypothetical protein AC4HA13_0024 [Escherichia phage vB_EcoM_4HA13]